MAILKVARLGHPVLRKKAEEVNPSAVRTEAFQKFIDDMIDTMHDYDGVGIAAPQVHVSLQIFVCEVKRNARYPDAPDIPLTVVINPALKDLSQTRVDLWEGCLSIPGMRGLVPRYDYLVCEGLDRAGAPVSLQASGFFARILQHEWDHLQGGVYLDRMPDMKTLAHLEEFEKFWRPQAENGTAENES